MPESNVTQELAEAQDTIRALQEELAETNRGLIALTEELEMKSDALSRSNAELEQFAYIASHDLQAPLRGILAFSEILVQDIGEQVDADAKDYLARIARNAQRMRALIDDLLAYSRVNRSEPRVEPVDLTALLPQVLDDLAQIISDSGGQVLVEPLPTVMGDARQLQQLFQNLIGNGLKFAKPGEVPIVRVTSRPLDPAVVELTVQDNGIGFDEQFLEEIFLPFRRLHAQEQYPGSGIGLAICQKIVQRHHGTLCAHSRLGAGAAFQITLPVDCS
jgi:light-regulated signal transduction histidine kinase (bacteriophytochrome)